MSFQGGQGRPRSRSQEQERAERAEFDNERKLPRPKKSGAVPQEGEAQAPRNKGKDYQPEEGENFCEYAGVPI